MDRRVRNLRAGEEKKHFAMLNICFQPWGDQEKWRRHYEQPSFKATENVVVVEENNEWMGGGTAWFRNVVLRNGKKTRVYIAGDGYVHPNHRGKGVYSSFMQSLNELARRRGASLGFGFISLYGTPFKALPKYGFIDIFYPSTHILVLNPEKFFDFLVTQLKEISFPKNLEGLRLKLTISFNIPKGKREITRILEVGRGALYEVKEDPRLAKNTDLTIKADVSILLKVLRYIYLKRRTLFLIVFANFLRGRFRMRFSTRLAKMVLGYR